MPNIGEVVKAETIGRTGGGYFVWVGCSICHKPRWVRYAVSKKKLRNDKCSKCALDQECRSRVGSKSPVWKGGKWVNGDGYVLVIVRPDDQYFQMADKQTEVSGYIREHRIVMARHLGRCLDKNECVHHLNGKRDDNRIENLELINRDSHRITHAEALKQLKLLKWRISQLEKEVRELKQLKIEGLL